MTTQEGLKKLRREFKSKGVQFKIYNVFEKTITINDKPVVWEVKKEIVAEFVNKNGDAEKLFYRFSNKPVSDNIELFKKEVKFQLNYLRGKTC